MSDPRLVRLDDEALGAALSSLELTWPQTPDVTDALLDIIERPVSPRRRIGSRTRLVIAVAVAVLVLAAAASAAHRVLDLGAIRVEPVSTPLASLPASPVPIAALGERVSMHEARVAADFPLEPPTALGRPDLVWLVEGPVSFEPEDRGVIVAMAWRPREGLPRIPRTPYGAFLMTFSGDTDVALKLLAVPFRSVPGHSAAYWTDRPHELDLLVDGQMHAFRVTGNILLWQDGALAKRLETALPRRLAAKIAFG